jgi:ABC-type glycerol-3-phosphate transport system substrate-binding protein
MAGCSSGGGNGDAASKQDGNSASTDAAGSSHLKLWMGWSATVNNNSLIQQYWKTEEPGVDVQVEATQGDALTALNLKMNTGGFEDAAIFGRSQVVNGAMKRSNLIQPLEQYFNMPEKYPNLAAIPKEYLDQMKDADGHIWSIPSWFDINPSDPWPGWSSSAWFIRTDILEKVGMTENDLKTLKGVETYLEKAAQLKDESGKQLLPLGILTEAGDENAVLAAFGVTVASAGGVTPVQKDGDNFIFQFDNPGFKAAYQWMNSMYRKGLIDPEALTDKKERYKEKNKSGRYAMNIGSFWNFDGTLWEQLDGPTAPGWYYKPIPYPQVEGVNQLGATQIVNPYPGFDTYISKNTKNLDAILKFFDYTLTPKPEQNQIVNEGPVGKYWDWIDQPHGKWSFTDPEYKELRNAGDPAKKAQLTPELWQTSSFSNEWYVWWTYGENEHAGQAKTAQFSQQIGQMGTTRVAEDYDMVKAKAGGVWEKYTPELGKVYGEYRAKLMMAKDDAQFEKAWNDFISALEKRAHWSELKQEWNELYQEMNNK